MICRSAGHHTNLTRYTLSLSMRNLLGLLGRILTMPRSLRKAINDWYTKNMLELKGRIPAACRADLPEGKICKRVTPSKETTLPYHRLQTAYLWHRGSIRNLHAPQADEMAPMSQKNE